MEHLKTAFDKVKYLLETYPQTRDCYASLLYAYYTKILQLDLDNMTAKEFLQMLKNNSAHSIPSNSTVERARRAVQNANKDLQGETYSKRKKKEVEYKDHFSKH